MPSFNHDKQGKRFKINMSEKELNEYGLEKLDKESVQEFFLNRFNNNNRDKISSDFSEQLNQIIADVNSIKKSLGEKDIPEELREIKSEIKECQLNIHKLSTSFIDLISKNETPDHFKVFEEKFDNFLKIFNFYSTLTFRDAHQSRRMLESKRPVFSQEQREEAINYTASIAYNLVGLFQDKDYFPPFDYLEIGDWFKKYDIDKLEYFPRIKKEYRYNRGGIFKDED